MNLFDSLLLAFQRPIYVDIWSPLSTLIVLGTSLWVFFDAAHHKVRWWFLGGLLVCSLWLILFPMYLFRRKNWTNESNTFMWIWYFLGLFCAVASIIVPELLRRSR